MESKYDKMQKCYHELTHSLTDYVLSVIDIQHAAEVLARTLYTFGNQGDQATPWDLVTGDLREHYIDRALEELKK